MSRNSNEYVNVPGPVPVGDINMTGGAQGGNNEPEAGSPEYELVNLRREGQTQARQIAELQNTINQLMGQLMATPNEKPSRKPKMATPEKYDGSRTELRTFLTNIDLYCEFNEVPNDQEKILMASTHMKGRASNWMQPYVEDYLSDIDTRGTKDETRALFASWAEFKKEMGHIFGEVDAQNQAEKAITRLKQTSSVSAYTAEFKQLQSRIDWDDAALRTVFEAGLKETVKDGLVHHDKPTTLHALIELATRIDNRLWERNRQRKQFQPTMANTRKQRNRTDRDGDTIMTGKVQDKSNDRKPRGKFNDGLSPEERKKRYDSKACLRCGEVGHFRRDCPKNESTKRVQETVRMLRARTPFPTEEPDETLSDLDLYEEARQATDDAFELVQEAIGLKDFKWDDPLPTDWQIEGAEVLSRLRNLQCWICGTTTHYANDCDYEGRIAISGPRADEIACRAAQEQPRFKEPDDEETPRTFKERMEQHENLRWVDCPRQCDYHLRKREETRDDEDDCCHVNLWLNECRVQHCHMHQPGEKEAHEELCWIKCTINCQFHQDQRRKARRVDNYYHSTISADECIAKNCRMHRGQAKRVTTDHLPATVKKPEPRGKTAKTEIPHRNVHWSFCYEDRCTDHYDAKKGAGYFPQGRKKSQKGRLSRPKN